MGAIVTYALLFMEPRHTAAGVLFELLVLKTQGFIHVEQDAPFGDICISSTEKMFSNNAAPAVST